jgi:hypothetical protein
LLKVDPSAPHDTLDEEIAKSLVTRLMVLSRTEFDLSAEIEEISRAGFIVYAGHRDKVLEGGRVHTPWREAIVLIRRIDAEGSVDDFRLVTLAPQSA